MTAVRRFETSGFVAPKNRHQPKTRRDRVPRSSSLQHTQPWLPSSPPSLPSRPASPRPRRAPRAPSAPPPSTVSRSRSPRYARPVGPTVAEKHRSRDIFHLARARRARRGPRPRPRDEIQPAARAGGIPGVCLGRSRPGHPVSRLEGPTTGPDPDRSRSGVHSLARSFSFPRRLASAHRARRVRRLAFFTRSLLASD